MTLEQVIVWCLYVAALEAQKKRLFFGRMSPEWQQSVRDVRYYLMGHGMTL